ncbi:MAG: thioredoxin [Bacteroidota bacterium]|jgi:thioredoxin 1
MVLPTNLKHFATAQELTEVVNQKKNVMVIAGRMGPMCIPVYEVMKTLEESGNYDHVEFRDMLFDSPETAIIRNLPECRSFMGLPFIVYYRDGKVVKATTSIQNMDMVKAILDKEFAA